MIWILRAVEPFKPGKVCGRILASEAVILGSSEEE